MAVEHRSEFEGAFFLAHGMDWMSDYFVNARRGGKDER
jgi:hypothetical protein